MLLLLLALLVPALARSEPTAPWPDTLVSRLEALALLETLNAEILASRSATFTLEKWCADHRLSGTAEPKIVARQGNDKAKPAFRDFLALWKDADPDIPIFKEARAEYARIQ